ncbi:FliA/WhiG family RNA polymerase sigma factor [Acidothermaceae bacterium B102]|nr:FliA/WhiG family RNA polymerase sigma factor [Acidothermaceae bacterium B102]
MTAEPTTGDIAALIEAHLPLVRQVLAGVAGHFPRHADREELAQAARLGLVEAAHRYDASRGVPFERWAAVRIRGAILDSVRAVDFAPRTLRSAMRVADAARCELEGELNRTPTAGERADRMGVSLRELTCLEGKAHRALVISLDAGVDRSEDEPRTLASTIVDPHQPNPLTLLEDLERSSYVGDALLSLPERLRDVVTSYFLDGEASSSIAARLGVTESRVSQMRSEALAMLRSALAAVYADEPVDGGSRDRAFAAEVAGRSTFAARVSLSRSA